MMNFRRMISCIDAHTMGEPFRVAVSGVPPLAGATILDKRAYFAEHYDDIRRMLMMEPRGHSDMYGGLLLPPVTEDGDFGILFMHNEGMGTMCGHGCIAAATVIFETGMMEAHEGDNVLRLDTPAGRITACAEVRGGRVKRVSFENVPTFVYLEDISLGLDGIGEVRGDIVYGGDFYVFADVSQLGMELVPENARALAARAMELKYKALEKYEVVHPEEPKLRGIYGTLLTTAPETHGGTVRSRNVCVFANGEIDRSPCGTGTSARLTQLYMKGVIRPGMKLEHHSIIDTVFEAEAARETEVGGRRAIVPRVSGSAYITAFSNFVLDEDDPLPNGFRL